MLAKPRYILDLACSNGEECKERRKRVYKHKEDSVEFKVCMPCQFHKEIPAPAICPFLHHAEKCIHGAKLTIPCAFDAFRRLSRNGIGVLLNPSAARYPDTNAYIHRFLDGRLKSNKKLNADEALVAKFFRWRGTHPDLPLVCPSHPAIKPKIHKKNGLCSNKHSL